MHPAATEHDDDLVRAHRSLGDFDLTICSDGPFLLDGGAMFGVVPKTLWSRRMAADANNCVFLGLNSVIVRTGNAVVVIETGVGNKLPAKSREIHQNHERLLDSYAAAGLGLEEVTHVVNTHLHFDHCGWNTTLGDDGIVRPTFPNARYFAAAGELAHGRLQLDRDRVSYLGPNYNPLIQSGQLTLIDPDGIDRFTPTDARLQAVDAEGRELPPVNIQTSLEITPGIRVERFPGHTETMLAVHIESGNEHACFIGDLCPTSHHLDATWVMGYDLDPITCIEQRKRFLKSSISEDWLVLFPHDHHTPMAKLAWNDKGKPVVERGEGNSR
ncbi:Glyoxylase, beta-lactamase superfamily II [Bryocella elongata]|uniref:Glyoxylase, beta-lactamase superfamily II n=1 Tax=Bryocella elongata TaxID=863522 RepID=A0A1H6A8G8_9BACT|nr:MBL fold metallo-hydrolase [Bryocella elongata]SEG44662.1 Glyoxylase, beta-lactamase superfamily II [Bryocella elongata]